MPRYIGLAAPAGEDLPVPVAVDWRQAELKLLSEPHPGYGTRRAAVYAWVATQPAHVQIEFNRARELRFDHPMVAIMAWFFGMDADATRQWFRETWAIGPTTL